MLAMHMPYNVTVTDLAGDYFSVFLDPVSEPLFTASPIATNHEPAPAPGNVGAPRSRERWDLLASLMDDPGLDLEQLVGRFLEPPLHSGAYELGFGTLYTAVYRPAELAIEYRWPGSSWKHSIGSFADGRHEVVLGGS
jgi:predicted choloylglycine hydrolase